MASELGRQRGKKSGKKTNQPIHLPFQNLAVRASPHQVAEAIVSPMLAWQHGSGGCNFASAGVPLARLRSSRRLSGTTGKENREP
jgi:hypothetical protein